MTGHTTIREFEQLFARICDRRYCIATCNASIAILGSCWAMGLRGREVIVPALTWPGAITPLQILGCSIKCCDVEPDFFTMDPKKLEAMITPETGAVFSADFMGYPCKTDQIAEICRKNNVLYLHDAATSLGSRYKDKQAGYFADIAFYSFGARKLYSCGEGGAIVYNKRRIHKIFCKKLYHPDHQLVLHDTIDWFFLNLGMNPIIADFNIRNIEESIQNIRTKASQIGKLLNQFKPKLSEPNFFKSIVKKSEVFKYLSIFSFDNSNSPIPIDKLLKLPYKRGQFKYTSHFFTRYTTLVKKAD
jgi:dTDP-4-amino-4,6-dideoxygalactose transaminase